MPYLTWIEDKKLTDAVQKLILSVRSGKLKAEADFDRNVIDPFSAIFSMVLFDVTAKEWKKTEIQRQVDKALSNAIGTFHQEILSNIDGWVNLNNTNQIDLVNENLKIIAELKNKHNTLNASGTVSLYKKLSELVNSKSSRYKGFTSYYVTIIPKSDAGVDDMFFPSDNALGERCKQDDKIRIIDGKRFYTLASGNNTALEDLFKVLPDVMLSLKSPHMKTSDVKFVTELFQKAYGK